jgi:hypothetical protein
MLFNAIGRINHQWNIVKWTGAQSEWIATSWRRFEKRASWRQAHQPIPPPPLFIYSIYIYSIFFYIWKEKDERHLSPSTKKLFSYFSFLCNILLSAKNRRRRKGKEKPEHK